MGSTGIKKSRSHNINNMSQSKCGLARLRGGRWNGGERRHSIKR